MATESIDIVKNQTAATGPKPAETTTTTTAPAATTAPTTTSTITPAPTNTVQSYTPTGMYDPANVQAYNQQREADLRSLYDTAQQNTLASLKTAYEQNMSDAVAARDQISPQYQESANSLAAEYERQRRNNNMQAAANGLNTGAGSQLALGQSMSYQRNQGLLSRAENQALDEANRAIADLQRNYQNAIAENAANNNYQQAAALLDEYENAYNRQLQINNINYERALAADNLAYERAYNENERDYTRAYNEENRDYTRQFNEDQRDYSRQMDEAANKASFGDFSGYASIYGDDIAEVMKLTWALQNPAIAWASGNLSAEDYAALTGKAPTNPSNLNLRFSGYYGNLTPTSRASSSSSYSGGSYSGGGYSGSGSGSSSSSGSNTSSQKTSLSPVGAFESSNVASGKYANMSALAQAASRVSSSSGSSSSSSGTSYGNIGNNKLTVTGGGKR